MDKTVTSQQCFQIPTIFGILYCSFLPLILWYTQYAPTCTQGSGQKTGDSK